MAILATISRFFSSFTTRKRTKSTLPSLVVPPEAVAAPAIQPAAPASNERIASAKTGSKELHTSKPPHRRPLGRDLIRNTADLSLIALQLIYDMSDVCPPLRSAVGGLQSLVNLAQVRSLKMMHCGTGLTFISECFCKPRCCTASCLEGTITPCCTG